MSVRPKFHPGNSSTENTILRMGIQTFQRVLRASLCFVFSTLPELPLLALPFLEVLDSLTKANKANRKQLDWVAQYDAITDARRLLVHHREVFCGNLHAFVRAALPSVDELRSLTAKNALLMWKVRRSAAADIASALVCNVLMASFASSLSRRHFSHWGGSWTLK